MSTPVTVKTAAKRTKIIATIGPASWQPEMLIKLLSAGMNLIRINMAHGTPEEHRETIRRAREAAAQARLPLAIMADTKGPGIRTGALAGGRLKLGAGQELSLVAAELLGNAERIPIDYPDLWQHLHPGDAVWLANGEIELQVLSSSPEGIRCQVKNSGVLGDHKRVNLPEARLPSLAEADRQDIEFAASCGIDYLAVSFVRQASDIERARQILKGCGAGIVAKMETTEAIANSEAIIAASDAVMVARGDLGVEIPLEEVPLAQRRLVQRCRERGVPVIIATQMLKSMVDNPRPTRAEVSDIATAILDGADAIMLSEETAIGSYPVESVQIMTRIAQCIERAEPQVRLAEVRRVSTTEAIGQSACLIAEHIDAAAIITSTRSGATARLVAKFRPPQSIVAVTYSEQVRNQLSLIWGVQPLVIPFSESSTDEILRRSVEVALQAELIQKGHWVVLTAGAPFGVSGTTNLIKVERV
ncbi:MAG TPA: pyruvate kinase [Candidatus Fraserbacteria bacterium]|nr:pyruvate kinase [Candidatus Fraserbacteria bacterium]